MGTGRPDGCADAVQALGIGEEMKVKPYRTRYRPDGMRIGRAPGRIGAERHRRAAGKEVDG